MIGRRRKPKTAHRAIIECASKCGDLLKRTDGKDFIAVEIEDAIVVIVVGKAKRRLEAWLPNGLMDHFGVPGRVERPSLDEIARVLA